MSFPPFRGHEPRAALRLTHFTVRMAPVSGAEKAALDAFFKGKRGERVLIEPVAVALRDYFATKGTTRPPCTSQELPKRDGLSAPLAALGYLP